MRGTAPLFAFLIHARSPEDFHRWPGSRLIRDHSDSEEDFLAKVTTADPMIVGEFTFGIGAPYGELVGVMRMPEQVLTRTGRDDVGSAAKVATARGVRCVGLGALTAPATAAGAAVVPLLPAGVTVTTGNAYTAAVARRNVLEALQLHGLPDDARVAVLGATGSVGYACSSLIIESGLATTLIGRTTDRTQRMLGPLGRRARLVSGLEHLRDAQVVLLLTSAAGARVRPEHLSRGTVLIDVCQPSNVSPGDLAAFEAAGVSVYEGGLVQVPGYASTYDMGLPPSATFACLAETYLMARHGVTRHSVGPADPAFARDMEALALRNGVRPRPLTALTVDAAGSRGPTVGV